MPGGVSVPAYSVEKLPNWGFGNSCQKHIFAKTSRGLPRGAPKRLVVAGSPF